MYGICQQLYFSFEDIFYIRTVFYYIVICLYTTLHLGMPAGGGIVVDKYNK